MRERERVIKQVTKKDTEGAKSRQAPSPGTRFFRSKQNFSYSIFLQLLHFGAAGIVCKIKLQQMNSNVIGDAWNAPDVCSRKQKIFKETKIYYLYPKVTNINCSLLLAG